MTLTTKVPIDAKDLLQIISNPEGTVIVDYEASTLKNNSFLLYLTNLNIQNIQLTNINVDSRYALMESYLNHISTLNIPELVDSMVYLLLAHKQVGLFEGETNSLVDYGRYVEDETRKTKLTNLVEFLDSIPFFLLTCNQDILEFQELKSNLPVVQDVDIVGHTFVNLFKHETFNILYYTAINFDKVKWYVHQFEKHIYGGVNLFHVISMSSNLMLPLITMLVYGYLKPLVQNGDNITPIT